MVVQTARAGKPVSTPMVERSSGTASRAPGSYQAPRRLMQPILKPLATASLPGQITLCFFKIRYREAMIVCQDDMYASYYGIDNRGRKIGMHKEDR
jgi:hypothetical protein